MKKIFWLLLAVSFMAAPGFAQELKFSGYLNSGVGLEMSSADGQDKPMVRVAGVDSEQRGGRFRLNGAYVNANENAGLDLRFQLQGAPGTAALGNNTYDAALTYAYGWLKPIEMLLLKAGLVYDGTFETQGPILRDDAGGGAGAGLFVKLTPIEGLNIGAGVYPQSAEGANNNNRIQTIGFNTTAYDVKYMFGVNYTMPDIFKINASFRTANNAGVASRSQARAIGEFQLLMIENLTAIIEVEIDNIYRGKGTAAAGNFDEFDLFKEEGKINFFETFGYKISDLAFGLNAAQYISKIDNSDVGLRFNPWVSYALADGKIVPRLDVVFFMGGDRIRTGGDLEKYDRRMDVAPTYNFDDYVISARPSIKINIDSRNSLEIGDAFYYRKPGSSTALNKGDGFVDNVFYIDVVTRF